MRIAGTKRNVRHPFVWGMKKQTHLRNLCLYPSNCVSTYFYEHLSSPITTTQWIVMIIVDFGIDSLFDSDGFNRCVALWWRCGCYYDLKKGERDIIFKTYRSKTQKTIHNVISAFPKQTGPIRIQYLYRSIIHHDLTVWRTANVALIYCFLYILCRYILNFITHRRLLSGDNDYWCKMNSTLLHMWDSFPIWLILSNDHRHNEPMCSEISQLTFCMCIRSS